MESHYFFISADANDTDDFQQSLFQTSWGAILEDLHGDRLSLKMSCEARIFCQIESTCIIIIIIIEITVVFRVWLGGNCCFFLSKS